MNVAVYLRSNARDVSAMLQDRQLQAVKERIAALDLPWKIVLVYRDTGSPGIGNRIYDIMDRLDELEVEIHAIVVESRDRFGRQGFKCDDPRAENLEFLVAEKNFLSIRTGLGALLGFFG